MPDSIAFDYFFGDESSQFSFFRIPRQLIKGSQFKQLSTDAKLLYGILLDRMGLSARNGWYDDQGRVYIYYTVEEIRENLNCGNDKALKLLAELDTKKGIGLIERVKQGQGKPREMGNTSHIYLPWRIFKIVQITEIRAAPNLLRCSPYPISKALLEQFRDGPHIHIQRYQWGSLGNFHKPSYPPS